MRRVAAATVLALASFLVAPATVGAAPPTQPAPSKCRYIHPCQQQPRFECMIVWTYPPIIRCFNPGGRPVPSWPHWR